MSDDPAWGIGVEEEHLLADARSGGLRQASAEVRAAVAARFAEDAEPELLASQVEVATGVCATLDDAGAELRRLRRRLGDAAAAEGCRLLTVGTHPTARWDDQVVTDQPRYLEIEAAMGQVARETVICGLHVHVGIPGPDDRIAALDGARPWLAPLLALSASSPFWQGADTGFASFRTPVFRRWPTTGVPPPLGDWGGFEHLAATLADAGAAEDATHIYWDLRPSVRYPTVEVRVADACPRLEDTLLVAGLARAVLRTAAGPDHGGVAAGGPGARDLPTPVWEAAVRGAARHGLTADLVHPATGRPAPAGEVLDALLAWCRPALEAAGDDQLVDAGVRRVLRGGTSAERQRAALARRGEWADVVDLVAGEALAAT